MKGTPWTPGSEFEHAHKLTVCYWKWPFFSEFSNGDFPVRFWYVYHFGYLSGSVGSKKSSVNHHFLSKKCQTWRVGTAISMDIVGFQFSSLRKCLGIAHVHAFSSPAEAPSLEASPRVRKKSALEGWWVCRKYQEILSKLDVAIFWLRSCCNRLCQLKRPTKPNVCIYCWRWMLRDMFSRYQ